MARRRLTRVEQQAETRARLLRAAAKVFARRGFDGASLADVAAEAGLTKGAVYSNFRGKDELFAALLEQRCRADLDELRQALQAPEPLAERLGAIGQHYADRLEADRDWMRLFIEFWSRSMRDAKLRRTFAAIWQEERVQLAQVIRNSATETLPIPAEQLASIAMAMINGLSLQMLVAPSDVPPATVLAGVSLLAPFLDGAAPAADPNGSRRSRPHQTVTAASTS